jgi:glycosyltransferase involved in cell wall biosynthesis
MKVLHILEATRGGTRRHVLDLLPALQMRGITCELIGSPARNPDFPQDAAWLRARGIAAHEIRMARGADPWRDAAALRRISAHLRRHRYDVIHCHSTKAGFLGRLANRFAARSTPIVYTPHCIAFDTALPAAERRLARWIEAALAPLTAHFIAVSQHEREVMCRAANTLRTACRTNRISVIYNGVDLSEFDALQIKAPPRPDGLGEDDFIIGCFGRLTRQKNQAALLHALPQVLHDEPRAKLLLVGGGEDERPLRRLAQRLGITGHIVWTGEVAEARPYCAWCDIIAQPSRWEGCPYSILEAMAARRAVVAAGIGGVPELLTDNDRDGERPGIIYAPSHPDDLVRNIVTLANDDKIRAQIGNAARRRVTEEFPLERMVEKTMKVYEKCIAS